MFSFLLKNAHKRAVFLAVPLVLAGLLFASCDSPDSPTNPSNIVDAKQPNITAHPQGSPWDAGRVATHELSVTATSPDGGTLSYKWYSNTSLSNVGGSVLNGKTGATLTLNADDYDENGTHFYYVEVTNTNNNVNGKRTATATSNAAQIQVNGIGGIYDAEQPEITEHPQSGSWNVSTADTFELTVEAEVEDGGTLSYQWYSNDSDSNDGGDEIDGEETDTLILSKEDYPVNGEYYFYVVVTNTNDDVTGTQTASVPSDVATVTVTGNISAPVFTVPADLIGSWRGVDTPEETYTITATEFSFDGNYKGKIVNLRSASIGSYLTIEYTANTANSSAVGKFTVIHYKGLTSANVSVALAYNDEDPDFAAGGAGGKATRLEAEGAYTLDEDYFADYSLLTKPLIDGVWRDGIFATGTTTEYIFDIEEDKTYYVWWEDLYSGPTPKNKTTDIKVSATYSDEETKLFRDTSDGWVDSSWLNAPFFTADRDGSVVVTVAGFSATTISGTYAVAFSTASIRPGAAVPLGALTENQWAESTIATEDVHVYTFDVTAEEDYYLWWNETGANGDGIKTANVEVQARYAADDALIFRQSNTVLYADRWAPTAWATPISFTAEESGTVELRLRPYNGGGAAYPGTYGIVYSTGETRPIKDSATLTGVTANGSSSTPTTALTLTFDKAVNGLSASDITLTMSTGPFGVTRGALSGTGPTYTLEVSAVLGGTVSVAVGGALLVIDGSPADVEIYGSGDNSVTLVDGQWVFETLSNVSDVHWYKVNVTAENVYRFWWADENRGTGTADIQIRIYGVSAWTYGTATTWQDTNGFNATAAYSYTHPAGSDPGTVYVCIRPYNENREKLGTYGVVYSTGSSRPYKDSATLESVTADGSSGTPTTALTLTFDHAINGLTAADINLTITGTWGVTKGALSGSGPVYTLGIGTFADGTVTVTMGGELLDITGSPATVEVFGDGGASYPVLEEDIWVDGDLPSGTSVDWYKMMVTTGTTYRVWCNERGSNGNDTKTGDVVVGAKYESGTTIFGLTASTIDTTWPNGQSFTSTATGTVYVRVTPYNGTAGYAGTYGVVYSTDTQRPAIKQPNDIDVTFNSVPASPASGPTTALTLVFSRAIPGLSADDITLTHSVAFGVKKGALSGSGPTYTLAVSNPLPGTVSVKVAQKAGYYLTGTRKTAVVNGDGGVGITALVEDQWVDAEVSSASSFDWYKIAVTAGTYRIWWNDKNQGPTPKDKDGDVVVGAWKDDGTNIFGNALNQVDHGWNTAQEFEVTAAGTVYVRVNPFGATGGNVGTYGIVYSTGETKPVKDSATLISVTANGSSTTPTTSLTLTFDKVVNGLSASDIALATDNPGLFGVTRGALSGSGPVYTLGVSAGLDGTLTVTVGGELLAITGSPATVSVYGDGGAGIPALVAGRWTDGEVPNANSVGWHRITVTTATANAVHYVWWNDSYAGPTPKDKDGDVEAIGFNSDGTNITGFSSRVDSGWETPTSFTPTAAGTYFVRIRPYNESVGNTGTYAITYGLTSTRPTYPNPAE
jgi:hypothetical protein